MDICFKLGKGDKPAFSRPWGVLFKNVGDARKLIAGRRIIAVGDMTSRELLKAGFSPDLIIVDGKIMRKRTGWTETGIGEIRVKNAPSTVSCALWAAVGECLSSGSPKRILVDGEEDLAVIPAVMLSGDGAAVLYGQPGEGLVVILVSASIKEKFARFLYGFLVKTGEAFVGGIKRTDRVLIIHHSDADGCASAEILGRALRARGVGKIGFAAPKLNPYISEEIKERIAKKKPDVILVADMGGDSLEYLEGLGCKVAVFDHHRSFSGFPRDIVHVNPNLLCLPQSLNPSASYLIYRSCKKFCKEIDWLAVVGSIGDKGEKKIVGLVEEVANRYGTSFEVLRTCAKRIDAAEAYKPGGAGIALAALSECRLPGCFASGSGKNAKKLASWEKRVREEINRLVQEHTKNAEFYEEPKLIVYEIRTPYGIKGDVANVLQELYQDYSTLVYTRAKGRVRLSMRSSITDLASAVREATVGIEGTGGGHPRASGADIAESGFQKFLNNLKLRLMG